MGATALSGSSLNDVYAGYVNTNFIAHFDGQRWKTIDAGALVYSLYAPGGGVVFVGTASDVVMISGSTRRTLNAGTSCAITALSGRSAADVVATTSCGEVLHYDGVSWTKQTLTSSSYLTGVALRGSTGAVVVGLGGLIFTGVR